MQTSTRRLVVATALAIALAATGMVAQRGGMTPEQSQKRWDTEKELQSLAVVERKVMMPMRDGVRLATDIYRPKDASGEGADDLGSHALQLQLLGRAQRRARAT